MLQFEYTVIQLNRLSWRKFLENVNPVVAALMVKMNIAPKDRPKVLMECARMVATLKLDPARTELIWTFGESYLKLTTQEMSQYEREIAGLAPAEKEAALQVMSSGRREGIQLGLHEGRHEGRQAIVTRQIIKRFGTVSTELQRRLTDLSDDELDQLSEDFLDFTSLSQLEAGLRVINVAR